jgi:hypothetical protein
VTLLPPSTNTEYLGSNSSVWFLGLASLGAIIPGCIHYFLPDGGAGVIAHIDLTTRAETIISIFAWYGAMQIAFGLMMLIIAVRYRSLVPLMLLLVVLMQAMSGFVAWFWKGANAGHHPPEHFGSVIAGALGVVFLALSLRGRPQDQDMAT